MKRGVYLVGGVGRLADSLPQWPIIALAVRLDFLDPASFHQERVTTDGRIFGMREFRTIRPGDRTFDTTAPFIRPRSNAAATRSGPFRQRFGREELRQLWNVITGRCASSEPVRCLPITSPPTRTC
jgi:lipopolysaccharide/colanic/teichoic acid biosynthesis glycosyltransferase